MCIAWLGDLGEGKFKYLILRALVGRWEGYALYSASGNLLHNPLFLASWADLWYRDSPLRLLTKGDNNAADDTELYARGQSFLNRGEDVIGSVVGFIPFVGYVTILLSEHPWLKQVMLGIMGLMVVLQRE